MDRKIVELFMQENSAWDDMINRHRKEIPDLEKMLASIVESKKNIADEVVSNVSALKNEMRQQGNKLEEIREALAQQQLYLEKEKKGDPCPVQTLMSQNILREGIRMVEKRFLDLKCNYLSYLANLL